ncbi:MAG: hypothetical protein LBI19_01800 [Oscillospiraceae bacterium]|jgi:hypothetical protein|nr:hypothetical protein [Oscillospiraceae bacterium]
MAINPIGSAGINPNMNIAPLGQPRPVDPAANPNTFTQEQQQAPEIGRNLAPAGEAAKFGMIELKDRAAQLGTAVDQAGQAQGSVVPQQMLSVGADGKVESGRSAGQNMESVQTGAAPAPGAAVSMFDHKTPAEAAKNDNAPSFAIETPENGANENAVRSLANGFNAMARAADEIGSDRLQTRLNAIYEDASAGLSNVGVNMGANGTLSVDFQPGQDSGGTLGEFASRLKNLANEVSQNPGAFAQNADNGMLYSNNGGALTQIAAQMSSIGQLFDSFM